METIQEVYDKEDIDVKIVEERNYEIKTLSEDLIHISEIFQELATLLNFQGEKVDAIGEQIEHISENISEGTTFLENTERFVKLREILRDVGILAGGLSLGSIGFLGGPIIGSATLISSFAASSGLVFIARKIS
jgi:hypothetical protein